jgi:3-hydroxymyristoyl/3-hydroxydecanoyl-(acyl carrier protein) dehydratase
MPHAGVPAQYSALSTQPSSMTWLSSLPHQIPFRAATAVIRRDEKSIEGTFVCTADDLLSPQIMLIEAMAQFGGGLVFAGSKHGMLSGIDACEITRAIEPGDVVVVVVMHEASFGGVHRFRGTGSVAGQECIRGRFYLSEA